MTECPPHWFSRIKTVTFDLDDTFWDLYPVMMRAEAQVLQFTEQEVPQVTPVLKDKEHALRVRQQLLDETPELALDVNQWRLQYYRVQLEHAGFQGSQSLDMAHKLWEVYCHGRNQVELFAGVEQVLQMLKGHKVLGTLTNGNADLQRIGLSAYFNFSLDPSQVGSQKPDSKMFTMAGDKAQCAMEEILHIGDDPVRDVDGARNAGAQALWFNPGGSLWPMDSPEPMQMRSWDACIDYLRTTDR
ncbi:MAG: HAD-IA family hydrolase [Gammaproteobacteria bacterium]